MGSRPVACFPSHETHLDYIVRRSRAAGDGDDLRRLRAVSLREDWRGLVTGRFSNLPLRSDSLDGHNIVLARDLFYYAADGTLFVMPAGATSDGASTPPEVWPLIPPFGKYWLAAVLHDGAYRDTLLRAIGSGFIRATLPKADCDALLAEAMEVLGVGMVERQTIYDAVVLAGTSSFTADRAAGWQKFMQ